MSDPRLTVTDPRACISPDAEEPRGGGRIDPPSPESARALAGEVAADTSRGVDVFETARDLLELATGPGPLSSLTEPMSGLGRVARFGENLYGERQYAEGGAARVAAAVSETVAEELAEAALGEATRRAFGAGVSIGAGAVSVVDAHVEVTSPAKLFTAVMSGVQPTTVAEGSAGLLSDIGTIAVSGRATNAAAIDGLQEDLLVGEYGVVLQGAAMAGAVVAGDEGTLDRLTSDGVSAGAAGVLAAWGAAAGDLWADVIHGEQREPRIVPVEELERRSWLSGF